MSTQICYVLIIGKPVPVLHTEQAPHCLYISPVHKQSSQNTRKTVADKIPSRSPLSSGQHQTRQRSGRHSGF